MIPWMVDIEIHGGINRMDRMLQHSHSTVLAFQGLVILRRELYPKKRGKIKFLLCMACFLKRELVSQPYLNYRHPNGHQQSNYTLGPKSSTPNPDRLINSWGESSYPRRNRATPVEAVVAGFAGRPRATYVDGYGNYTLPLSEPPENNDLGGQTITARGHSNAFGHPDKCDSATDSDRNADRMMDPKLPNSGYTEASYGFRETSNRYSEQKASAKSDADFRIDFGRRTE